MSWMCGENTIDGKKKVYTEIYCSSRSYFGRSVVLSIQFCKVRFAFPFTVMSVMSDCISKRDQIPYCRLLTVLLILHHGL